MHRHLWIVIALCACGKSASKDDGKAGATTPEGAVRGFVEALVAQDVPRAQRFLPDDAACDIAPPEHRAPCLENGKMMRDRVPSMLGELPKGAKIVSIEKSPEPTPAPELGEWSVKLDGVDQPEPMLTVKIGDRYYAAFAMRKPD